MPRFVVIDAFCNTWRVCNKIDAFSNKEVAAFCNTFCSRFVIKKAATFFNRILTHVVIKRFPKVSRSDVNFLPLILLSWRIKARIIFIIFVD